MDPEGFKKRYGGQQAPGQRPPPQEICGDNVDNDGDGAVDEAECLPPSPPQEICGDNVDNDGDGAVDEAECLPPPLPKRSAAITWIMMAMVR
jgi:hypothetical protein